MMTTQLQVAVTEAVACVRVEGPANFAVSVDFKSVATQCCEQGGRILLIDLAACPNMDSTFLGILVGLTGKLDRIELLNPCARVTDLLENLGVLDLMSVGQGPNPFLDRLEVTDSAKADKRTLAEASLEAHKLLMEVNPDNVPKFKNVARFLEEDLERQG